ncbi:MAG TPA: hypothetical protein VK826_08075 [Bacteroidia bacterium]|nr:hypothetical protein [Bacteroidia bacterium]
MRKLIVILLVTTACTGASGQKTDSLNYFPEKTGFEVSMSLVTSYDFDGITGFSFGFGREYALTEKLGLRPQLLISFTGYKPPDDVYVESTFLEVPLHLMVRPFKTKLAPFFTAGTSLKMNVPTGSTYLFAEGGLGVEWSFPYSSIAPEFRFSLGKEMQIAYVGVHIRI